MRNPYVPYPVTVRRITIENEAKDIKTFELVFDNPEDRQAFDYCCGQFAELSLLGSGESPIGIASSPMDQDFHCFIRIATSMNGLPVCWPAKFGLWRV